MDFEARLEQEQHDNMLTILVKQEIDTLDIFFNVGQKTGEKNYPRPSLHARRPAFFLLFQRKTNAFQEYRTERRNFSLTILNKQQDTKRPVFRKTELHGVIAKISWMFMRLSCCILLMPFFHGLPTSVFPAVCPLRHFRGLLGGNPAGAFQDPASSWIPEYYLGDDDPSPTKDLGEDDGNKRPRGWQWAGRPHG